MRPTSEEARDMEKELREFCAELFDKLMSVFYAETLEDEAYMLDLYKRAKKLGIDVEP